MTSAPATTSTADVSTPAKPAAPAKPKRRHALRTLVFVLLVLGVLLVVGRLMLPFTVKWYVNRVIDQSPLYDGKIEDVDIHLYRGAYAIRGIRINKKTGSIPVPFFSADRLDLSVEWKALMAGNVVGTVHVESPEINFVDGADDEGEDGGDGSGQTGAGAPWLAILTELFPFKINSVTVDDGSVHFRTYQKQIPVDVYLGQLEASVTNLTNIHEETAPLITTVTAKGLAMDQARFEYQMKLDPFSYKPTFNMTTRLLNLDVTKVNDLARGYGSVDFEKGWFDLVVEVEAKEGQLRGYVKPLFRNLEILNLPKDMKEDNFLQVFWEAIAGTGEFILQNQPRDQFGTLIPFTGSVDSPKTDVMALIGNVLRNAFIRAYLPRLNEGGRPVFRDSEGLEFGAGTPLEEEAEDSNDTSPAQRESTTETRS